MQADQRRDSESAVQTRRGSEGTAKHRGGLGGSAASWRHSTPDLLAGQDYSVTRGTQQHRTYTALLAQLAAELTPRARPAADTQGDHRYPERLIAVEL